MSFGVSWHTLLDHLEELPEDATLLTPLPAIASRSTIFKNSE
jgi:hypothetical protein